MITAISGASVIFGSCGNLRTCSTRCFVPSSLRHDIALRPNHTYGPPRAPYQARRNNVLCARNPRYDDDYVEVDDEDRWTHQVEVAVKAGLVLAAVSIARSLLGVALTVGTVVFGIYVATKVWSKQDGADPPGNAGRMQSKRRRRSSIQDDDGLSDVWFEKDSKRKRTPKKPEEPFW